MTIKRGVSAVTIVAGLTFAAAPAAAQVCAGYPSVPGSLSVGGNIAWPEGGTSLGAEASYNFTNPLGAFASFNLLRPDDDGAEEASILAGGISYEIGDFLPIVPAWLSVCPLAGLSLTSDDGASTFAVPLGVGFGTAIPVAGEGIELLPFAIPQFVLTRVSVNDVDVSDHNFGIGFGALVRMGQIWGGVTANRDFVESSEVDLSVRGGISFTL